MAARRVQPDQWNWLLDGRLRFFLRVDPLIDGGYQPAVDFGIDPEPEDNPGCELLEVRTRAAMPAGWRLQFVYGKRLYLPGLEARLDPTTTNEFRRPDAEVPGEGQRRIWPADHRGDPQ